MAGRRAGGPEGKRMTRILVDADGCPVKEEACRVAGRFGLEDILVSNTPLRLPRGEHVEGVVVRGAFDAADDWIVEHASADDVVITADIPLASRCLKQGCRVLGPRGEPFTDDRIGEALADRELFSWLRDLGAMKGGAAPFSQKDRSRFLQALDQAVQALRRRST